MRVKAYDVLTRAVEEGVAHGWTRAHKHLEDPSPDVIEAAMVDAVTSAICEVFEFPTDQSV
jgi:hypothetical protein